MPEDDATVGEGITYKGYITIDEVKERNIDVLKDMSDNEMVKQIELISQEIDEYCNTRFQPTEDMYKLDLCDKFYTRHKPLLEVNSLKLITKELVPDEEYFAYTEISKIVLDANIEGILKFRKALEVNYSYGYNVVPATVKQVLIDLIKLDEYTKNYQSTGVQSENWDGEYSYTANTSKDFTPTNLRKDILSRLKDFVVDEYTEPKTNRTVKVRVL
jgi:hypothetical protein